MGSNADPPFVPVGLLVLVRVRARALMNHARDVVREAPVKVLATAAFITIIWFALFMLFWQVFRYFQMSLLQSVVAIPLIFHFFFVALLVLLTLSNAILVYGALFRNEEAAYLLCSPMDLRSTVAVKYLESLFFSSWSLLLLGLPLMMAIARVEQETWFFYPYYVLMFLAFIPIPGALGLLGAWSVARFVPRSIRKLLVTSAALILLLGALWGLRSVRTFYGMRDEWIDDFFERLSLVQLSVLPSTWVTRGIEAAYNDHRDDALRYLVITVANALFLSWFAVHLVAWRFLPAYDRAGMMDPRSAPSTSRNEVGFLRPFLFFLPHHVRIIAAKDWRQFVRDPMQWSQLAILFGLMGLYLLNMPRVDIDDTVGNWREVVPYLNLTAVSFILATFTSRFVFPMVSLEGRQFWLLGLLPVSRSWILVAKCTFAFAVTFAVAAAVMLLAAYILRLDGVTIVWQLLITGSVCYGLSGLAVGIGARLPVLGESNPARIANGLGGTINLIASVGLIFCMLSGVAAATFYLDGRSIRLAGVPAVWMVRLVVVLFGLAAGTVAMAMGSRHLKRMEL